MTEVRGNKIIRLLEIIESGAATTAEIFSFFACGYQESYGRLRQNIFCPTRPLPDRTKKQRLYSLLNVLKRQGFITRSSVSSKKPVWKISAKGLKRIGSLKKAELLHKIKCSKKEPGKLKILIFDIPERYRTKRAWLRSVLKALGFSLLQQSVWIGKNKFPEWLIKEMENFNIMRYIHILEITKRGTIKPAP